jgi:hypothetical protein
MTWLLGVEMQTSKMVAWPALAFSGREYLPSRYQTYSAWNSPIFARINRHDRR